MPREGGEKVQEPVVVRSPYSGEVVGEVPATPEDSVPAVVAAAVSGSEWMARQPTHRRAELLERAADLIEADLDEFSRTLTAEVGKPTHEARREAGRAALVVRWSAEEIRRRTGEVLTMDALPMGEGRLGYTTWEPCGVVVAITPFNYPAHLGAHKIAPALAAGNSVILKPPNVTPLSGLFMHDKFLAAGFPAEAFQVAFGSGPRIGGALCADRRVRKISFTGSVAVGENIARTAGLKRLTCELGANCALLVFEDADLEAAASAAVQSGFVNSGQVCTSVQRILVAQAVRDEFVSLVAARIDSLKVGDPAEAATTMGPVIAEREAERITGWFEEAAGQGARIERGGGREGRLVEPTLVLDPPLDSKIWREELFGPGVALRTFETTEDAIRIANDTRYGLSVGVFTTDLDRAMNLSRALRSGSVHVNSGPLWRTAFQPYGGFGDSGFGKEGVKYAIQEMSEQKLVVIHPAHG